MTEHPGRRLFVNLPVRDLERSVDFFTKLGFRFDPDYTDETATCMIVNEGAFVMLLVRDRFREFTANQICDTTSHTEGLFSFSCSSRGEVDALVDGALGSGGRVAMEAQDHGFMYGRSFYDLDGHHWEVVWMDPDATRRS